MVEIMAVIHPDAGIVGNESNLIRFPWSHVQRIGDPRTAGYGLAIAAENLDMVTVQMHRMIIKAAIHERHFYKFAFANRKHRRIRKNSTVDRMHKRKLPIIEAESIVEYKLVISVIPGIG